MSITKSLLTAALVSAVVSAAAQEFYNDSAFLAAVQNGTRTQTGVPGKEYKSNFAEYKITASFDDVAGHLYGEETVTYHYNCGEQNLSSIVVNLYRDIYKEETYRHRRVDRRDYSDGVNIAEVALVSGKNRQPLTFTRGGTQIEIALLQSINPGSKITLYIKWDTKIAQRTHLRGGKYGTNSWFVPYWYPQVAVYDDIYGWDRVQHTGNEEFYFEFANYDVKLTVGHNMAVWATGTLQNAESVYSKQVYKNYLNALKTDEMVHIIGQADVKTAIPGKENTWHYKADSVADVVFCCSNESRWSGKSFAIDNGRRRVLSAAVYRHPDYAKCIDVTKSTIEYLSSERPGVPYPYPHMTLFEGSGGMEFPMMVNESIEDDEDLYFTTSHEVTHTFFPFVTGLNQNKFGFLDEGLTMYVPQYFQGRLYSAGDPINDCKDYLETYFGSSSEVPVFTPSYKISSLWPFTMMSYYAPEIGYTSIEMTIGPENMETALKQFVTQWRGKHPHPYDLFYTFESVSGKNLKHFYQNYFKETGGADMGIDSVYTNHDTHTHYIVIRNHGGKILPVTIAISYAGSSDVELASCYVDRWQPGSDTVTLEVKSEKEIKSVEIITKSLPDQDDGNNYYEMDNNK